MAKQITYDLLIHPFYGLMELTVTKDLTSSQRNQLKRNSRFMLEVWLTKIREIEKNPNAGLLVIHPLYEERLGKLLNLLQRAALGEKIPNKKIIKEKIEDIRLVINLFEKLKSEAKKRLGGRAVILLEDKTLNESFEKLKARTKKPVKTRKYKKQKKDTLIGTAMGEYYKSCVKTYANRFSNITSQPIRFSRTRSTSIGWKNPKWDILTANYRLNQKERIKRAKRIFQKK